MALTFAYNVSYSLMADLYRASNWGTVFSSNLWTLTAFDYFDDTAVVNDCLYFCSWQYRTPRSDLQFNIWTALVADDITIAWEYYHNQLWWIAIPNLIDETNCFRNTGIRRVKFPAPPSPAFVVINWQANRWFYRARITSVTNITEWWANITDRVREYIWTVNISWTTEEAPATFEDLYQYMITNYPYVPITKRNNISYDFTPIWINILSPLVSKREIIEIWQNSIANTSVVPSIVDYLRSWVKYWDRWFQGSTFIIYWANNQWVFSVNSSNIKMYWCKLNTPKPYLLWESLWNYAWYVNLRWERYDCDLEVSVWVPKVWDIVKNCRIIDYVLIGSTPIWTFDWITLICASTYLVYCYQDTLNFRDLSFEQTGSLLNICYLYLCSTTTNPQFNFINPTSNLWDLTSITKRPFRPAFYQSIININWCFFYDASAWTYTDYTTQANSTSSTPDIPVYWDVWDSLVFVSNEANITQYWLGLYVWAPTQINDYQYIWEYWSGSAWVEVIKKRDQTSNFTKNWYMYFQVPVWIWKTTISWVTWYVWRCRITSVWTWTPMISQARKERCSCISDWSVNEKYTVNLKIVDELWSPINWVSVICYNDDDWEEFNTTTDSNWVITEQQYVSRRWYFDPENFPAVNSYSAAEIIRNNIKIKVSKVWYETYETTLTANKKVDTVITLKTQVPLIVTPDNVYVKKNPENIWENRDLAV